jgi:hypothetical protein
MPNHRYRLVPRVLLIAFVATIFGQTIGLAPSEAARRQSRFERLSLEVAQMQADGLVTGDASGVVFDERAARKARYSPAGIRLVRDLVAFTNEILASEGVAAAEAKERPARPQPSRVVASYFDQAEAYEGAGIEPEVSAASIVSEAVCGSWWNPLPRSAATWVTFSNLRDPAATLRSWGYHQTAGYASNYSGSDWTRPQTYKPWACGFNSFRDHALISGKNSLREQKYWGWSPNGEPNPEVHTYVWPYPLWPAYVRWWHDTR